MHRTGSASDSGELVVPAREHALQRERRRKAQEGTQQVRVVRDLEQNVQSAGIFLRVFTHHRADGTRGRGQELARLRAPLRGLEAAQSMPFAHL
jgi:hypothetical protein